MIATGCVSIPQEHLSQAIETQELSDHVHFLAQPALKGRKPKTWESATVRQYLKNRFKAYGLVPWPSSKGYEQPFGFGTNVIGVLPGADPNLADEIVILSAHYDHVGKTKKGVLLGACDNASGVAALLEIAEQFALCEKRPKRPICFASFDCEERCAFGAFAFTCQEEFEKHKIAGVVNVDLLGRDFLDVVEDSLFVIGTEHYPTLRSKILQAGKEAGVKVLPIGTDLVGPRGDHVAFEAMEIPILFFSCGLYKDYHKPTDTAEKLNYQKMTSSAQVVFRAVDVLANSEDIGKPVVLESCDKQELLTLKYVLEKINPKHEDLKINAEKGEKLRKLAQETQHLLDDEKYTIKQRRRFVKKAIKALSPVLAVADETFAKNNEWYLLMNELYAEHSGILVEWYRDMVRRMLKNKPGLFDNVNFKYQAYDLSDDEISFVEKQDGQYDLDVILTQLNCNYGTRGLLFKSGYFNLWAHYDTESFSGTKNKIVDYCLLLWRKKLKDESYGRAWAQVLKTVTGHDSGTAYGDWMRWWTEKQGWANEKQWLVNLSKSDDGRFAFEATKIVDINKLCELIRDPNAPALKRDNAIFTLDKNAGSKELLTLVDVLTDETPLDICECEGQPRFMQESYPFADHRFVKFFKDGWERSKKEKKGPRTIGGDAEINLKILTGQDFGKDAKAWRKWIKANIQ